MQKENLKKQELIKVLQEGEGQFVEFKEKADNSLTKEIVAFEIKPLSTHFFVEMESQKKSLPGIGLKDGIKDDL
jgi:hypothetical protein